LKNKSLGKLFSVFLIIILIDQATKLFVDFNIPKISWMNVVYPYGGIAVFKDFLGIQFSIVHETNLGGAWGLLSDHPTVLLSIRIALISILGCYLIFAKASQAHKWPLTLILAGAIGNVIDIFIYSHVIDMFYFKFGSYSYPVFNVADSFIFIGIVWIIFQGLFSSKKA
jgi:signal peptidase II